MKKFFLLLLTGALLGCGYYYFQQKPSSLPSLLIGKSNLHTLEMRVTAEEIMQTRQKELLKDSRHVFLEPTLLFAPHLLMEVKFAADEKSTDEGELLWSLTDGEMVFSSETWEKSHGYEDCLNAKVSFQEFKVFKAVVDSQGSLPIDKLYASLQEETKAIDKGLEGCLKKKLLSKRENALRLHFKGPKFAKFPMTAMKESVVELATKRGKTLSKNYSGHQIKEFTSLVFGSDFAIRETQEVFLPIHVITIQNPDGSTQTTYWNALSGQRITRETLNLQ